MTTFACVLRSGGRVVDGQPYTAEHVRKLVRGVRENLDIERAVCLTDVDGLEGVESIPLETDWPGWWAKIELFRPGLFGGPVLYLDLDTVVTGDLSPLVRCEPGITMVADFGKPHMMNSSAMAWSGDMSIIWRRFAENPDIREKWDRKTGPAVGDQGFIHETLGDVDTFAPAHVVSFKMHARHSPPRDARAVSFHGRPKCDDKSSGWAFDDWSAL